MSATMVDLESLSVTLTGPVGTSTARGLAPAGGHGLALDSESETTPLRLEDGGKRSPQARDLKDGPRFTRNQVLFLIVAVVGVLLVIGVSQAQFMIPPESRLGWADAVPMCLAVVLVSALRVLSTTYLFVHIGDAVLPRDKWHADIRREQVERLSVVVFKFVYFTLMTSYGYYVLKDKEWMPPALGGSGDMGKMLNIAINDPPPDSALKAYFALQFGYHMHSWLFQSRMHFRKDYVEMMLHHTATVYLMYFSLAVNIYRISAIVLFVHDIADIAGYFLKATADTKYTTPAMFGYVALLGSWGYTRLYVYPFYILDVCANRGYAWATINPLLYYTGVSLLFTLQVLHVYWFGLFIKMGIELIFNGRAVDLQDTLKTTDPLKLKEIKRG